MTHTSSSDNFALIRVDASELQRVSSVVLDFGRSPHGVTTSDETTAGDLLFMTGQGLGMGQWPTRLRPGVLVSDDPQGFRIAYPGSPGDGGSPVLHNLNAYGVMSSTTTGPGPYGTRGPPARYAGKTGALPVRAEDSAYAQSLRHDNQSFREARRKMGTMGTANVPAGQAADLSRH